MRSIIISDWPASAAGRESRGWQGSALQLNYGVRRRPNIPVRGSGVHRGLRDADLPTLTAEAEAFLAAQSWCAKVLRVTPIFAVVGVVGVFRCSLITAHPDAEPMVWVIVGDLPPAYIAHEPGDSWQDALRGYVDEMSRWVEAVREGSSVDELIPVNVPPTPESAELLASRVGFVRANLVDVDPKSVENDV